MAEAKTTALGWIDSHMEELSRWHSHIWDLAEPAWREHRSSQWYVETLREYGFEVEAGSAGMPTAFSATWSNGDGPTLLTYAEYDAVPGNCQAAEPTETPRGGLSAFAPGHTDPHSALGISTLAGLLATQEAMKQHNIGGTLRYTGEPAEKMQGSKLVHGLRGYYDDVDTIVSFHPFYMLPLCNTARWDTQCGAYFSKVYTFVCDEPQTWQQTDATSPIPASHSAARAPGANAALMTMYTTSKSMQDSMLPANGGWSLSEAINTYGQATADNLPARYAQIQYSWRCPTVEMANHITEVLDRNAAAAAAVAHCQVHESWVSKTRPGITNHVLADTLYGELAGVGAPTYGDDAVAFARQIQQNLGQTPAEDPFLPECSQLISPQQAEAKLREHMPAWQTNWTSDDYVEMTHYAPTVRFYISRPALAAGADRFAYPGWVMNALGGHPAAIDPTIEVASRTIAATFLRLLAEPDLLTQARAEFDERRAANPVPPLLEPDFQPPVDLAWPDYGTNDDGARTWMVPQTFSTNART
ncbi:peptidase M20 [Arthrobacter castelli]|uniref:peptidase M20 n=1 Tax=Arthrobacter castelli TaxID=271431 RepID=UPI00040823D5|nr:peptidase M20 [Arthrobacter castelli]